MSDVWQIATKPMPKESPEPSPYVSLNKRGEIAINSAAWQWMGDTYNVTLLYDAATRRIGVKFPVRGDDHFFAVGGYGRGRRLKVVRAARLLKQFGIEIERTMVFTRPEFVRLDGVPMIVLKLDQARPLA